MKSLFFILPMAMGAAGLAHSEINIGEGAKAAPHNGEAVREGASPIEAEKGAPVLGAADESFGFFSLIIDPMFVPAENFEFTFPSVSFSYGRQTGKASWMFGPAAASDGAFGISYKYQYDFTEKPVRPGVEGSLFVGASRSKVVKKEDKLFDGGDIILAGGASLGFFLKADVSQNILVAGRLGASIKPLTVKSPDISTNMWLGFFGVEMRWRLF